MTVGRDDLRVNPIQTGTNPQEALPRRYVMDSKGETIYRRRPFYYILEGMTG
jgi:hypothetical protein